MKPVDFVFVDPPFVYSDEEWKSLLAQVKADEMMFESNRSIEHLLPADWGVVRSRRYGDSFVVIARRKEGLDS
jgi:16S rRNA G966 N2-methylase RsmD